MRLRSAFPVPRMAWSLSEGEASSTTPQKTWNFATSQTTGPQALQKTRNTLINPLEKPSIPCKPPMKLYKACVNPQENVCLYKSCKNSYLTFKNCINPQDSENLLSVLSTYYTTVNFLRVQTLVVDDLYKRYKPSTNRINTSNSSHQTQTTGPQGRGGWRIILCINPQP